MSFQRISYSVDLEVVGLIPQVSGTVGGLESEDLSYIDSFSKNRIDTFPERIPQADSFKLDFKAKVTDWLDCSFLSGWNGMLCSADLSSLFGRLRLHQAKAYPVNLNADGVLHDYRYFYLLDAYSIVDFEQSQFQLSKFTGGKVRDLPEVNSEADWIRVQGDHPLNLVEFNHLVLREAPDLFKVPRTPYILISDATAAAIKQEFFSGMTFDPPRFSVEIKG